MDVNGQIRWPFAKGDVQSGITDAASIDATVWNTRTILEIDQLAQDSTLNLTIDEQMEPGADLFIKTSADGTGRTFIFGTNMQGQDQTVTANKSVIIHCVYDGSSFRHVATQQLN